MAGPRRGKLFYLWSFRQAIIISSEWNWSAVAVDRGASQSCIGIFWLVCQYVLGRGTSVRLGVHRDCSKSPILSCSLPVPKIKYVIEFRAASIEILGAGSQQIFL